ncbi:alkylated DNA repair protein alkB-like protein 8 [Cucumis melo var. makuwa]|nr:alkylated DNA repair protein alkB-like protein 8 [Cucumis melo var. makuwa]
MILHRMALVCGTSTCHMAVSRDKLFIPGVWGPFWSDVGVCVFGWAVEQEDKSLLTKWMPLSEKYVEEWVGPGSPRVRSPSSMALESIPEMNENNSG